MAPAERSMQGGVMVEARRVKRLRDLIAQIELLPVSPDRDRLLSEFRSRAVDLDTGVTPRAMLPLREPEPAPVLDDRPPPLERSRSATRLTPPAPAPAVEPAAPADAAGSAEHLDDEPFWVAEWLSLDDSKPVSPPSHVGSRGGRLVPPWTLGLRG
jgi:hypothetical protein